MDTDVLVVGAGPTGLMLANQLARRGVRVLIIDRHAGPSLQTRALGVQARTLEIYAQLGIVDRALELGKRGTGANIWAQGRKMARVPLGDAGQMSLPIRSFSSSARTTTNGSWATSFVIWACRCSGTPSWSASRRNPTRSPQRSSCPTVRTRKLLAAWVAGCDGARSAVRELSGITFPGAPYEHVFFVADTEVTGSMVPDEVNVYLWQDGFHLLFPMRGKDHWRIVGILPSALRDRTDLKFEAVIPSLRNEAGAGLSFKSCTWFSTYRIHHRSAVALSRPPLLPARRCRTHPQPGRRARHEHRLAGCL